MASFKTPLRYLLALLMMGMGVAHFVYTRAFIETVPVMFPEPMLLVLLSGMFEILGGAGLLLESTRRFAAWGLVLLYLAVFPANINMAVNDIRPDAVPQWALWARLPFQLVFVLWAFWFSGPRDYDE